MPLKPPVAAPLRGLPFATWQGCSSYASLLSAPLPKRWVAPMRQGFASPCAHPFALPSVGALRLPLMPLTPLHSKQQMIRIYPTTG